MNLIRGIRDILAHTAPSTRNICHGKSPHSTQGDGKHHREEEGSLLLMIIQNPVPWIPISSASPLPINVTFFGTCPTLVSINVTVTAVDDEIPHGDGDEKGAKPIASFSIPVAAPPAAPSYGLTVSETISAAVVASWGHGSRALSIVSSTTSGDPCSAPVHIAYDAFFPDKTSPAVARDTVVMLLVAD